MDTDVVTVLGGIDALALAVSDKQRVATTPDEQVGPQVHLTGQV